MSSQFTTLVRRLPISVFSVSAFQIRRYFSSGWAFLIPYLAAYLLYYLLKWPVNPADAEVKVRVASESGTWVPCLLHVYWLLHAVNVGLAVIALRSWWKGQNAEGPTLSGDVSIGCRAGSPDPAISPREAGYGDPALQRRPGQPSALPSTPAAHEGIACKQAPTGNVLQEAAELEDKFQVPRIKVQGNPADISQKETVHAEIACEQAPTTPLSPLPPVKWLGLRFLRFRDFPISRFSARLPAFPLSRFAAALLPSPFSLLLQRLLPWALLALLFWIPGVYLEYPADPWDHYARINEWSVVHAVGEHSTWAKSSYFLAYSLIGKISPPTRQLFWLDFYYTGVCLLLCWQYDRLARAVGLGGRASMLFVILQTVLFGNDIFGFFRYYGISSSIFAQIGAVALTRVAIEYASQKFQVPRLKFQGTGASPSVTSLNTEDAESTEGAAILGHEKAQDNTKALVPLFARFCAFLRQKQSAQPPAQLASESSAISVLKSDSVGSLGPDTPAVHGAAAAGQAPPVSRIPAFPHLRFSSALPSPFSLLQAGASVLALLLLIAFNHVQGLGIAGLGLLAVAIWRLIDWKRSMIWWLAGGALVLSVVAILWFPRDPALVGYVRDGWLTPWYGFNVFAFSLPVGDRTLQIIGIIGLVNLAAGLLLLRRNHVVGWLTIAPIIALSLPIFSVPLVGAIVRHGGPNYIITFQRMLFAIPPALALVALGERVWQGARSKEKGRCSMELTKPTAPGLVFQSPSSVLPDASALSSALPPSVPPRFSFSAFELSAFSFRRLPSLPLSRLSGLLLSPFSLLLVALTALLIVPANGPFYNRFWQALAVPPDDLQLKPVLSVADSAAMRLQGVKHLRLVTTPAVAFVLGATVRRDFPDPDRYIGQSATGPLNTAIAIALSGRPTIDSKNPTLTHDPFATDHSAWTALGGSQPQFVVGIKDFRASSTALQNPAGRNSNVFTSEQISIDPLKSYQLELSVRQRIGTNARAYLAIAWYNEAGRLLESQIPQPAGAGSPAGWGRGTYSYFGLIDETAPTKWTIYRKSFGSDEPAAIPANARFVRVGALLNCNATPGATIQLTNVRLWKKSETAMMADGVFSSDEHHLIVVLPSQMLSTYASQAGQASHHWPAHEAAADLAGGVELAAAAHAIGATPVNRDNTTFELFEITDSPTRVP